MIPAAYAIGVGPVKNESTMTDQIAGRPRLARPVAQARTVTRPAALVTEVYNAILDRITLLQIPPGARITVDSLARELGVSQTPIREAISRLEAEGLVLKTHLVGPHAAPQLDRAQVKQLFELRLLIEPAGAAMAAAHAGDRDRAVLQGLHEEMVGLRDKPLPAYGEFARKDAEFHAVIAAASGNAFLADALGKLHTHVHIFRLVFNTRVTSEAIDEHEDLLSALMRGDAAASEQAMRVHILASRARILGLLPS